MDITPKSALSTIKELEHLGFDDHHFQFIHHWGNFAGKDSSLESHKNYLASVRNFQVGSNNFKVAEKLVQCLERAKSSKGEINFTAICDQINATTGNQKSSDQIRMSSERGLYVVTLNNQHPISANADDKRIAHIAIKVNRENCKFGKAVNLSNRRKNYYKTFGEENVNFQPVVSLSEIDIAEKEVLKRLKQFRQISPSGNLTEWLQGIDSERIIEVINESLAELDFQCVNLLAKEKGDKKKVNFSQISNKVNEKLNAEQKVVPAVKNNKVDYKEIFPEGYQLQDNALRAFEAITVEKEPVVFLTGRAGTGKTTFVHYLKKNYSGNFAVLTPTGMTALNIGGQTIHSFFRFPPRAFENEEIKSYHNKAIDHLDLIIIDEISMVQSDLVDHMDFALRKWRKSSSPFGGIQMLLVGDCFQLSPWIKYGAEKKRFEENYSSQWFFDAKVFQSTDVLPINLTTIYRQRDNVFTNILNRIRIKYNHEEHIEKLNQRCYFDKKNQNNEDQLVLTTTNDRADNVNAERLKLIGSASHFYTARETGKITKEIQKTIPFNLELKVGAQVMVTKNIEGAANGTLAVVKKLLSNEVLIETVDDQREIECSEEVWEQFNYDWNSATKKISSHKTGEYRQIPLRLGWAITIHKSQGLTFDSVKIDLTGGAFSPGQTYVALSRCRTLENVSFDRPLLLKDIIVDPRIFEFYTLIFDSKPVKTTITPSKSSKGESASVETINRDDFDEKLGAWYEDSDEQFIGPLKSGTPLYFIQYDSSTFKLNQGTKRAGVKRYLELLKQYQGNLTWSVVPNANGRMNKVAFGPEKIVIPSVYLYLLTDSD